MSTDLPPSSVDTMPARKASVARWRGRPPPAYLQFTPRPGNLSPDPTHTVGNFLPVSMDACHVSTRVATWRTQGVAASKGLVGMQARGLVAERKMGGGGGGLIWERKTCRGCGYRARRCTFLVKPILLGMPTGGGHGMCTIADDRPRSASWCGGRFHNHHPPPRGR
jgi:hypothetical protein